MCVVMGTCTMLSSQLIYAVQTAPSIFTLFTKPEQPLFALMVPHLLLQYPSPLHTNYTGNLRIHKLYFFLNLIYQHHKENIFHDLYMRRRLVFIMYSFEIFRAYAHIKFIFFC